MFVQQHASEHQRLKAENTDLNERVPTQAREILRLREETSRQKDTIINLEKSLGMLTEELKSLREKHARELEHLTKTHADQILMRKEQIDALEKERDYEKQQKQVLKKQLKARERKEAVPRPMNPADSPQAPNPSD